MTISVFVWCRGRKDIYRRSELILTTHTHNSTSLNYVFWPLQTTNVCVFVCEHRMKRVRDSFNNAFDPLVVVTTTRGRPSSLHLLLLLLPATHLTHLGSALTRWRRREPTQPAPNSCPFFPSGRRLPTHLPTNFLLFPPLFLYSVTTVPCEPDLAMNMITTTSLYYRTTKIYNDTCHQS